MTTTNINFIITYIDDDGRERNVEFFGTPDDLEWELIGYAERGICAWCDNDDEELDKESLLDDEDYIFNMHMLAIGGDCWQDVIWEACGKDQDAYLRTIDRYRKEALELAAKDAAGYSWDDRK